MARSVAEQWLKNRAKPDYRIRIYTGSQEIKKLPNLLRSFRDGKVKMAGVQPLNDLGIKENFDSLVVWSSNREALLSLANWCETRGLETSGIW